MSIILDELIGCADTSYRDFHARLIPTIDKDTILGVRGPICKTIAKKYVSSPQGEELLHTLPHRYYDENLTHAYMLGFIDTDNAQAEIEEFLPYMDNWAVVDCCVSNLKKFFKSPDSVLDFVKSTLKSDREYIVRFGIVSLLCYYLTDTHAKTAIELVKGIKSDKFYIKMAQAWFFATALSKYYELALPVIEGAELDAWTHNKAIQKARESYRVCPEAKKYLNTLKVKSVK